MRIVLALALTLPDICSKIEDEKYCGGKSYINWVNDCIYPYYKYDGEYSEEYIGTEFDGKVLFSLRCVYLHAGNADLKIQNKSTKIDIFELCLLTEKDSLVYVDKFATDCMI